MSVDDSLETMMRKVFREELRAVVAEDRLLTAEQVAEILAYTDVNSVYRLKREGKLEAVYLTEKTYRFRNSDVQKLIRDLAA